MIEDLDLPGWKPLRSGKVRDLYINARNELLIVATDRVSAFDWILPTKIPNKGKILTQLSLFWFERLEDVVPHHVLSLDVPAAVAGRAVIAQQLKMIDIECVARGFLAGSGWSEYVKTGAVCGQELKTGLLNGSKIDQPIFTPATKAEIGEHDMNIDLTQMAELVGASLTEELRRLTLEIYENARRHAYDRGIIVADTKLEFGLDGSGELVLADEVLTPDSSRFWDKNLWKPGDTQASFDKQFLRDWLVASGWDQRSSPPELPSDIVEQTSERYEQALFQLTGRKLS